MPRARSSRHVADRHAVHALHHHHVRRGSSPSTSRARTAASRAREVAPQLRGVRRLAHQVELVEDGLLELGDDLARPQALAVRPVVAARSRASACSSARSRSITARMPGRSTLTATSRPSCSVAACTCAIEARGQRRPRRSSRTPRRPAGRSARSTIAARLGAGERRHAVLQLRELVGDVGRQQVAPRREHLAELDEDRAELLERQAQPLAARAAPPALEPGRRREVEREAQRPEQVRREDDVVEPVPHEHALDREQAAEHAWAHHQPRRRWLAGVAVAPRLETREPCLEPLDVVAQPVDVPQELLGLEARRHVAAFFLQVLRALFAQRIGRARDRSRATPRASSPIWCAATSPRTCASSSSRSGRACFSSSRNAARSPRRPRCEPCRCAARPSASRPASAAARAACPRACVRRRFAASR